MEGISVAGDVLDAEVDMCSGQSCYHNETEYGENQIEQMKSLVERSLECSQEIKINCLSAPLKVCFFFQISTNSLQKSLAQFPS